MTVSKQKKCAARPWEGRKLVVRKVRREKSRIYLQKIARDAELVDCLKVKTIKERKGVTKVNNFRFSLLKSVVLKEHHQT